MSESLKSGGLALLPTSGDASEWSDQQKALMTAAGLSGVRNRKKGNEWVKEPFSADRATVEAFLLQCERTKLDPWARQIYCIERGGKWSTSISIDGFRLVAERSGRYAGQTEPEFTADGVTWTNAWLAKTAPAAARVGVRRSDFVEPLFAVATWEGYVPRNKDGASAPSGQWVSNGANQLAKCAEMLALRKAFPDVLSGLYGTEEMDQATVSTARVAAPAAAPAAPAAVAPAPARVVAPAAVPAQVDNPSQSYDWTALAAECTTVDTLRALHVEAENLGELGIEVEAGVTVNAMLRRVRDELLAGVPAADSAGGAAGA
jgi:phage recombination protein Bet